MADFNETFKDLFRETLREVLPEFLGQISTNTPKSEPTNQSIIWKSRPEVQVMTNASRSSLDNWQKKGWLVPFKVGRKLLYKESDIHEFIESRRKTA